MWKKLRSNRDPADTLYTEIRREFAPYFSKAGAFAAQIASNNPRSIFACMVVMILVSFVLTFTVFRHPEPVATKKVKNVNPLEDGFGQIFSITDQLQKTISLKNMVDSLSGKQALTRADSLKLDSALDLLQQLHSPKK